MKIKYLIATAAISAAVLAGSMAFAQTPVPVNNNNANSGAPAAATNDWRSTDLTGIPADGSTHNGNLRGGMMGRYDGRGMMNNYAPATNRAPRANAASIVAFIFVATITVLLAWAFMILGIIALIRHLKDKK
jgi:hypothetical protein